MRLPTASVVVLVALLVVAGCGDDSTTIIEKTVKETPGDTPSSSSTTTTTTTTTAPEASGDAGPPFAFETPSGNIDCAISASFVNCQIQEADWTPGADCPSEAGRHVSLTGDEAAVVGCGLPSGPDVSGPTLDYGQRVSRGAFACDSSEDGLTCTNESAGHGFFLARENVDAF